MFHSFFFVTVTESRWWCRCLGGSVPFRCAVDLLVFLCVHGGVVVCLLGDFPWDF